ncbi:MAG: transcriptional regulator [Cyclobacteriaceae bacterium]|nr:transcriptional regulator [Cyclobacteriaceae bacterium HetDA_MAG_MS6]
MENTLKFEEARATLIQAWGTLGTSWGINKTMAQINILLLTSSKPLTTDDVMRELSISRGNANMNIRALLDWGVVYKKIVPGDRKEYFYSEKDIWEMARIVARERRKRELEPALKVLRQISQLDAEGNQEAEELKRVTQDLEDFTRQAIQLLERLSQMEKTKFGKLLLSIT